MIIVDIETTGVNPLKHAIVSIGAVDFSHPENQFYGECRIWEGAEINPYSMVINGFTQEQVTDKGKQSCAELLMKFAEWAEQTDERTVAGQNPFFDVDFLRASAEREKLSWTLGGYRIIDLHSVCYAHYLTRGLLPPLKNKRTSLNLDAVLYYVGMPDEPKPHNGLRGAKMEAEAFSRLIHGKNLLKEFEQYPVPEHLLQKT